MLVPWSSCNDECRMSTRFATQCVVLVAVLAAVAAVVVVVAVIVVAVIVVVVELYFSKGKSVHYKMLFQRAVQKMCSINIVKMQNY